MVCLNDGFGDLGNVAALQSSQLIPKYYQLSECDFFIQYALGFLMFLPGNINKKSFFINFMNI